MPELLELVCPNPACPARTVEVISTFTGNEDAEVSSRERWESRWLGRTADSPGECASPECPVCGTEGVVDGDDERLAGEEEALGRRCDECGIVTANPDGACPYCGERFPEQTEPS